jgi:hypothetical protein
LFDERTGGLMLKAKWKKVNLAIVIHKDNQRIRKEENLSFRSALNKEAEKEERERTKRGWKIKALMQRCRGS